MSSSSNTVPRWLEVLMETEFFEYCKDHRKEKNLFCVDCCRSLCCTCVHALDLNDLPHEHRNLQIVKYKSLPVIKLDEFLQYTDFDITSIKVYIISRSVEVIHFKREQKEGTSGKRGDPSSQPCKWCGNFVTEGNDFCSIFCKVSKNKRNVQPMKKPKSGVVGNTEDYKFLVFAWK